MQKTIDVVIPAYNAAAYIGETVEVIAAQALPDGWSLSILVSDDGSTDDTAKLTGELQTAHPALRLVASDQNTGRSEAINRGVAAGDGSIVLICDADCRFTSPQTLSGFLEEFDDGKDAVIGFLEMTGEGFWARYTGSVTDERRDSGASKGLASYSSANLAVRRSTFEALGGFSDAYSRYGFEDKDFLVRLETRTAAVAVRPDLRVRHDDDLSLDAVCRKQFESGRHSAAVFRSQHPEVYRAMPYARCDAALGRLPLIAPLSGPFKALTRLTAGIVLAVPLGFTTRRFFVRVALCAAYFHGTRLARKDTAEASS